MVGAAKRIDAGPTRDPLQCHRESRPGRDVAISSIPHPHAVGVACPQVTVPVSF
jgi:hypothetical protein